MKQHTTSLNLLLLLFVAVFSVKSAAWGEGSPIKIGFVGDFSSVSQAYTKNAFNVAQFAVDEINSQGGVLGNPVQLVHRDGANDPALHYRHVVALAREENVVAVFGGASSPCVIKASAACKELKIPYLVSIGNSQSIVVENGHPYVCLFEPNSRMESLGFSIFPSLMPWKRYAWIGPDYAWGRGIMGFFKQYFEEIGSPITWTAECWHPLGDKDYEAAIQKVIAGQPAAVAGALRGLTFTGLRGESVIRAVDGQMNCPSFFGRLTYLPDYPVAIIASVIEIPAEKTWLPEEEVIRKRAERYEGNDSMPLT